MTVVLNSNHESLRLSEEAWTDALAASLAHGWQCQHAESLTFRDFALLLPSPEYEAERRKEGGYTVSAEDAAQLALAMLRAWPELQQPDADLASAADWPTLDVPREELRELCSFCQKGAFTITVEPANSVAGEGEAGRGAAAGPAGADRQAAPASDDAGPQGAPNDGREAGRSPLPQDGDPLPEDSMGLGALGTGRVLIGCVDEVNGPGAAECASYRPTNHELRVLAEHWAEQALATDVFYFVYAQTGSSEWRRRAYAERRRARIADILGQEAMDEVLASVKKKVQEDRQLSDQEWAIYERGDPAEWRRFQDQVQRDMDAALASKERALYRAAAQFVIGYRSGFGQPSAICVEEGARASGRILMRWVGDDPGRTDGVIQSLLAGPLAEARLLAGQVVGDTLDFDLSSAAENLLALGDDQELVELAFLHRGSGESSPWTPLRSEPGWNCCKHRSSRAGLLPGGFSSSSGVSASGSMSRASGPRSST
jgi:hypothetical protein